MQNGAAGFHGASDQVVHKVASLDKMLAVTGTQCETTKLRENVLIVAVGTVFSLSAEKVWSDPGLDCFGRDDRIVPFAMLGRLNGFATDTKNAQVTNSKVAELHE